jgi:tetratricopeptide (TPR) repeat protein
MKSISILSILVLSSFSLLLSQPNDRVTAGQLAYEDAKYDDAIIQFNEALNDFTNLDKDKISLAYYYRGKAKLMRLYMASMDERKNDVSEYQNALFEAFDDFNSALNFDDGLYEKLIQDELLLLKESLLQAGLTVFNRINNGYYEGDDLATSLHFSQACMDRANAIEKDYLTFDILAQIYLVKKDSLIAQSNFILAADYYSKEKPEVPDLLIAYVYYRIALLDLFIHHDDSAAICHLRTGNEILETEFVRLSSMKDQFTGQQWEQLQQQYDFAVEDLMNFELELYANNKDLQPGAIEKFQKAIEMNPEDYNLRVAYASLLEMVDREQAIDAYKEAIAVDSTKDIAFFNLGVLYFNNGAVFYNASTEESEFEKSISLEAEARSEFKNAYGYLKKAYAIDSFSEETLSALKQCALRLGKLDDYKFYDGQ